MDLKEVMKSRRKTLSISQLDLAEMAEVSLATVKDIERGKGNPSLATVNKIIEVLGMEIIFQVRQTV
ncbi:helix-turn-helix transcriptional regulator [Prevotella sp.]|uniref:helix-turn-helix transcriptional regulator n=1 Tax=Prevotella sp. TaxID=59823 RepID=UPI0025F059D4|nr:helix-turn-helix domain-containing protein [Prevotella sp.]MCI7371480.1 helix-turn-helix domain-containing protein [Prevotella sp.]MDY4645105.1 helix-turn-helix domain-containing protein [Prevotella sp.]